MNPTFQLTFLLAAYWGPRARPRNDIVPDTLLRLLCIQPATSRNGEIT